MLLCLQKMKSHCLNHTCNFLLGVNHGYVTVDTSMRHKTKVILYYIKKEKDEHK